MSFHFPLPKIRSFRFSLHTSRLSLHGEVTMVALKFAMSSHFPLPKIFSPSGFVPPLSNGTSRATSDRKPKTNDQILPSPILFFPSKNWIKLIPKTIGNRKRDCGWGGSGWSTLPEKIYRSQSTNQEGVRSVQRTDLCFAICRFSQVRLITPSHLTHNLFFYFQ